MAQRIRKGAYGLVQVAVGEYAGGIGYYDADEDDTDAVVYIGTPGAYAPHRIPRESLWTTNVLPLPLAYWKRDTPKRVEGFDPFFP